MEETLNVGPIEIVKKKRGRKPKVKDPPQSDNTNESKQDSDVVVAPVEKPAPKKRGRKPKGGKIVVIDPMPPPPEIIKQNVILHLRCNLKDIYEQTNNTDTPINDNELIPSSKSVGLNYHVISNLDGDPNENKMNAGNKSKSYNDDLTDRDCGISRDISSKLKELQTLLHTNEISDQKSACFWCTYSFDNLPVYIPKYKLNNSYQVYGCFCSPECATSHLYSENIDTSVKFERYQLINYIYSKIYDYKQNIKPAPNPYYLLDKYFGNLSISEYRKLLRNDRLLMVIDKPLTRILPELHEESNNFMMSTQCDNTTSGIYKVKKKSVKPITKNSIVHENFGAFQQS